MHIIDNNEQADEQTTGDRHDKAGQDDKSESHGFTRARCSTGRTDRQTDARTDRQTHETDGRHNPWSTTWLQRASALTAKRPARHRAHRLQKVSNGFTQVLYRFRKLLLKVTPLKLGCTKRN